MHNRSQIPLTRYKTQGKTPTAYAFRQPIWSAQTQNSTTTQLHNCNPVYVPCALQAKLEGLPPILYQTESVNFKINLRDKSMYSDEWNRITRVIVASENMKDFLEISQSKSYTIEEPTKNYCPIKLEHDGSNHLITIPCIYKTPEIGDSATIKLLIVYQVCKRVENSPSHSTPTRTTTTTTWEPLHRAIQVSVTVPMFPCLRMEYSKIKSIDSVTSLGLIKLQNLTQVKIHIIVPGKVWVDKRQNRCPNRIRGGGLFSSPTVHFKRSCILFRSHISDYAL